MKALLVLCTLFLAVLFYGAEANEENFPRDQPSGSQFMSQPSESVHGDRHRRVTCDILSLNTPWGSLNHAACAAHCLVMGKGYRGGYCDGNGICNCRK